ncbi:YndM family protein [Psychrobacillus antarcticus]|uniref:YndM family protein n=1 Tax=Psychrobacillus antarcticus TaxID=2879115 RepID=UPI0024084876|nr:YndM family protein [Psychrobacillus antarcticus]
MKAFLMKFVMITAVLWVALSVFYDVSISDMLITSVVLTVVGYVGDVFLLPKIGNVWATISDFVIALVVICFLGSYIYKQPVALGAAAFSSALLLMVGEFFLHRYMHIEPSQSIPDKNARYYYNRTNLQAEFAKEVDINSLTNQGKEKNINKKLKD